MTSCALVLASKQLKTGLKTSQPLREHVKDTSLFDERDGALHVLSHAQSQHHPRQPPPGRTQGTDSQSVILVTLKYHGTVVGARLSISEKKKMIYTHTHL